MLPVPMMPILMTRILWWAHRMIHDSLSEMVDRSSDVVSDGLLSDPLSDVLQDLRIRGASYGRCELTSPWGITFPAQSAARFHFVAKGNAMLRDPEGKWIPVRAGDVALLPRGTGHSMAHGMRGATKGIDDFPLEEIGDRTYRLRAGGSGEQTLLFCCSVTFEEPAVHPLLELMPALLLVRGAAFTDSALPLLLETMAGEVLARRV